MARRSRRGGPTARWQSGRLVGYVRHLDPRNYVLPCALRCRDGGDADSGKRFAALAGRPPFGREVSVAKLSIEPGAVIDGFTIAERVHSGGMGALWGAKNPNIWAAPVVKNPP